MKIDGRTEGLTDSLQFKKATPTFVVQFNLNQL